MSPYHTIVAYCPLCEKQMRYETVSRKTPPELGCPKVICPHCHQETYDLNITELAIRPRRWYEEHYSNPAVYIPLLILPWIALLAFALIGMQYEAIRNLPAVVLVILIFGILILGNWPAWRYLTDRTSIKVDARFDREYKESEKRLQDPEYKRFLQDSGYLKRMGVDYIL